MDEKYKRVKVLGKGSFGKAYLVENTEAGELCVVKQMETCMMDPKKRNEAVKEAMLLKRMDHKNIVRFQEVFMTRKGRLCIVMDYADGGDVHMEINKRDGSLIPEDRILEWFVQTCFALKHVHDRKVLHRDLKTQNIFLMQTGQIKLGDFGIARVLDFTKDYAKTMVGTPYYLSPEIIEDKPYNFKSDVWSCGVVLYEMTTLKHPFDADSLVILASKILKDQVPPLDPMYSQDLVQLIRCMLSKDAGVRPLISDILAHGFLQGPMQDSNAKYRLDLDLSEFSVGMAPAAPLSPGVETYVAADPQRVGLAERRRREVASAAMAAEHGSVAAVLDPEPLATAESAAERAAAELRPRGSGMSNTAPPPSLLYDGTCGAWADETRLGGELAVGPLAANPAPAPTAMASREPEAPGEEGQPAEEEYEEEFDDYSGSEEGREEQNALQQSVANLRLGGGEGMPPPATGAGGSAASSPPPAYTAVGSVGGSRVGAKADSLQAYLRSQVPEPAFAQAYTLIRASAEASTEQLQRRMGELIGADKTPELFTLFQLLCFLEDVSSGAHGAA